MIGTFLNGLDIIYNHANLDRSNYARRLGANGVCMFLCLSRCGSAARYSFYFIFEPQQCEACDSTVSGVKASNYILGSFCLTIIIECVPVCI